MKHYLDRMITADNLVQMQPQWRLTYEGPMQISHHCHCLQLALFSFQWSIRTIVESKIWFKNIQCHVKCSKTRKIVAVTISIFEISDYYCHDCSQPHLYRSQYQSDTEMIQNVHASENLLLSSLQQSSPGQGYYTEFKTSSLTLISRPFIFNI